MTASVSVAKFCTLNVSVNSWRLTVKKEKHHPLTSDSLSPACSYGLLKVFLFTHSDFFAWRLFLRKRPKLKAKTCPGNNKKRLILTLPNPRSRATSSHSSHPPVTSMSPGLTVAENDGKFRSGGWVCVVGREAGWSQERDFLVVISPKGGRRRKKLSRWQWDSCLAVCTVRT